jgi:prophage antirepressor-like protein
MQEKQSERRYILNNLQIFRNPEFGQVRTLVRNGEPWLVGKDVAEALGYLNTRDALSKHVDSEDKSDVAIHDGSQNRNMTAINESGLYSLIMGSKLPNAKKFKHWVTSEVLPSLRKTGTYSMKSKDDVKLMNARSRMANTYLRLAKVDTLSKEYKNILVSKATQVLAGEEIIPLPKLTQRTMSADEVGKELGISSNMVGRLANKNGLKQDGVYGEYRRDKSRYSAKEVDTFVYYPCAVDKFKELI